MGKGTKKSASHKAGKYGGTLAAKGAAVVAKTTTKMGRGLGQQFATVADPLTNQEQAIMEYLITLCDPWVVAPSGVPLVLGLGTVRTNKVQLLYEFESVANTYGMNFATVCMDNWITLGAADEIGQSYATYANASGDTQGIPIWYSEQAYIGAPGASAGLVINGITLPNPQNIAGTTGTGWQTTGLLGVTQLLLDTSFARSTTFREVACGMEVCPDSSYQVTQGKVLMASTSLPAAPPTLGGLCSQSTAGGANQAQYTSIVSYPQDLVSVQRRPLPGWPSGKTLKTVAIPSDPGAFFMQLPPGAGASFAAFGQPQMAVICIGAEAGQSLTVRVVQDYEFTFSFTHLTGVQADPVFSVGPDMVANGLANITKIGHFGGSYKDAGGAKHITNNGMGAFVKTIADRDTGRGRELVTRPAGIKVASEKGFFGKLGDLALSGLGKLIEYGPQIATSILARGRG